MIGGTNVKRYLWIVLAAVLCLGAGFFVVKRNMATRAAAHEGTAAYQPVAVTRGAIVVSVDATGKVAPAETIDLAPPGEGKVLAVLVEAGDYVKRGQVLVELDTSSADIQLLQLENNVQQAQVNADAARADYERMSRLFEAGAVTRQQLETARDKYETAAGSLKVAKAQLAEAQAKSSGGMTRVTAPVSGLIVRVDAQVGANVDPKVPIISLTDPGKLVVEAQVDENDINQVKPGQKALITLDALPGREFQGTVKSVGGLGTEQGGVVLFTVKVALNDPTHTVKPGMNADAAIVVLDRPGVITVPNAAVEMRQGQAMVRLYTPDGEIRLHPVTTGHRTDTVTEIVQGLEEGDRVAVPGARAASGPGGGGGGNRGNNRRVTFPMGGGMMRR